MQHLQNGSPTAAQTCRTYQLLLHKQAHQLQRLQHSSQLQQWLFGSTLNHTQLQVLQRCSTNI
jgi:hypothetical protein